MRIRITYQWVVVSVVMLLIVSFADISIGKVEGNGQALVFIEQESGPYMISMGTVPRSPVKGRIHITVTVSDKSSGIFITDADVIITGIGPSESASQIGPMAALSDVQAPRFYDLDTQVDYEGRWVFTVDVISNHGQASAIFPIEVVNTNYLTGIISMVALISFLLVLGLSIRFVLANRSQRIKLSKQ